MLKMALSKDLKMLLRPYYYINIILSFSYIFSKKLPPICNYLFYNFEAQCELDSRESEILFFLMIVVMIRTRKAGSVTMINYLSSSFMYTKVANLILWFYADFRMGLIFAIMFILVGLLLPEPTYSGPENIVYFRTANALEDEINRNKNITWLITFYTAWNPSCVNFAPIFAQLSTEYHLENLKFGKIDVGRYPEAAKKYYINDSSLSRQLPTVILFRDGKEAIRRPCADAKGKLIKFFFSEDNVKATFDLNNIYNECKSNPLKKKKEVEKNHEKSE
uniref:Thioredoxin domain-containing protein n=1 Tax=Clastoptera arizonana TaxID=38151 RepID=A0A1B6DJK8_9HEMI